MRRLSAPDMAKDLPKIMEYAKVLESENEKLRGVRGSVPFTRPAQGPIKGKMGEVIPRALARRRADG